MEQIWFGPMKAKMGCENGKGVSSCTSNIFSAPPNIHALPFVLLKS